MPASSKKKQHQRKRTAGQADGCHGCRGGAAHVDRRASLSSSGMSRGACGRVCKRDRIGRRFSLPAFACPREGDTTARTEGAEQGPGARPCLLRRRVSKGPLANACGCAALCLCEWVGRVKEERGAGRPVGVLSSHAHTRAHAHALTCRGEDEDGARPQC